MIFFVTVLLSFDKFGLSIHLIRQNTGGFFFPPSPCQHSAIKEELQIALSSLIRR